MIYDLLKNTEDVIQAFNPFYSDVEHQTLGKLSENTLYKSIAGLTLKVSSHFIFFSAFGSLLNLILFPLFFFFYVYAIILEIESVRREQKQK